MLQKWLNEEQRLGAFSSTSRGGDSLEYKRASEIAERINFWRNEVDRLERQANGKSPFQNVRIRFR